MIPRLEEKENTMKVTTAGKTVKVSKVKKKAQTVSPITIKNAKGTITCKISGGNTSSKKALKVNVKNGNITVKKGTKKGKYKIRVTVKATGTYMYDPATKTVTATVIVK